MSYPQLIEIAKKARERAYAPYSDFLTGAAILCDDGSVYDGCNVENASFSPTCCAERVAVFSAVADGKRSFRAIAVVGGRRGEEPTERCLPCGVCRQVLSEFSGGNLDVVFCDGSAMKLSELLPHAFTLGAKK